MPTAKAKQLGKLVRDARKSKGLSLRALEKLVHVDHSTLAKLENGEIDHPSVKSLEALSEALDIPLGDLFTQAGYARTEVLPSFPIYLRSKYNLSAKEVAELEAHFDRLKTKKSPRKKR